MQAHGQPFRSQPAAAKSHAGGVGMGTLKIEGQDAKESSCPVQPWQLQSS